MHSRRKKFVVWIFCLLILLCACSEKNALERIKETGAITVLTRNNAHSYYIYRDTPMGFEYDLAKAFAEYMGVQLKIVTPRWDGLIKSLNSGKGDFIAASMTITPSRENLVDFSVSYLDIQQHVIVHKSNYQVKKIDDLAGKTVHVRQGTSYEERLRELKKQGLDLNIKLHDDTPTEELISMVAEREIDITIADSNVALLNRRYYPDVRMLFAISEPQPIGWAVKKGEKALLDQINRFFEKMKQERRLARIYKKYYSAVEVFDYVDLKKYHHRLQTRLPKYEGIIKQVSKAHGFDWRFITAVIYQESHFDPRARSSTGVRGLMQLTLTTAKEMGIQNRLDPAQSISGGVKYLKKLYDRYENIPGFDRLLFTLASYNVGHGHVLDARKIARKKSLDPQRWSSLEQTLPLLRHRKYYKKTTYGYCRGTEPVRFVHRVLTYYDILKREGIS
ncbi:MAG: membrane-bound lytic murein transglycosylase MltF [Deltaproteobacteria bacterium]|nr:membrane-bound lytic murein transglycosylase MltF [Deltaproteobacteria bacterium]